MEAIIPGDRMKRDKKVEGLYMRRKQVVIERNDSKVSDEKSSHRCLGLLSSPRL